ncbi:MAG: four helix bundle protein [Methanophagales archaeon]|nr:four helix bundle protein [Methanophagales archaeon]
MAMQDAGYRRGNMVFPTYKDLEIYQLSHGLVIKIHRISLSMPKFELYEEGSQLRRAAKSIPANIVEGFGRRRYKNEFIRFLTFALASCDETKEHLKILYGTGSLKDSDIFDSILQRYEELGRKIHNFIKAVESGHKS